MDGVSTLLEAPHFVKAYSLAIDFAWEMSGRSDSNGGDSE